RCPCLQVSAARKLTFRRSPPWVSPVPVRPHLPASAGRRLPGRIRPGVFLRAGLARGDLHPETPCGMMRERVVLACFPANPDSRRETEKPDCPWRTTDHVEPTRGPGGSGSGFPRNPGQDSGDRRGPRSDRSGASSPPSASRPEGRPDSPGSRGALRAGPGPLRDDSVDLLARVRSGLARQPQTRTAGPVAGQEVIMQYVDPHIHMVSRVTDDYKRMALAGCVLVSEPAFWAGFDRSGPQGFRD